MMAMRTRAWKLYNRMLDCIAAIVFPISKPTNFWIGHYRVHSNDITMAIYTMLIGFGLAWYFSHWLWIVAAPLCMILAVMLFEWFF
jgi:hypothetical protein